MAEAFVLSKKDRDLLEDLVRREVGRRVNTPIKSTQESYWEQEDHQAPEVYIAKLPENGIPPIRIQDSPDNDLVASPVSCRIYKLAKARATIGGPPRGAAADRVLQLHDAGFSKRVHNISEDSSGVLYQVVQRDKFGNWIIEGRRGEGGTVINNSATLTLGCPATGFQVVPFDTIQGSTTGLRFNAGASGISVEKNGPLLLAYKVYVTQEGASAVNSDGSIEARISFSRDGGAFTPLESSYAIGLIDDVDELCQGGGPYTEKSEFEGTAVCPMTYVNAQDGDVYRVEVQKKSGTVSVFIPSITSLGICSFFTLKFDR